MAERNEFVASVETEARTILGEQTADWMARPSVLLDGMAPVDLATSPDGARAVLHELRRASAALRATRRGRS